MSQHPMRAIMRVGQQVCTVLAAVHHNAGVPVTAVMNNESL